jgi:hypothetical protein
MAESAYPKKLTGGNRGPKKLIGRNCRFKNFLVLTFKPMFFDLAQSHIQAHFSFFRITLLQSREFEINFKSK